MWEVTRAVPSSQLILRLEREYSLSSLHKPLCVTLVTSPTAFPNALGRFIVGTHISNSRKAVTQAIGLRETEEIDSTDGEVQT